MTRIFKDRNRWLGKSSIMLTYVEAEKLFLRTIYEYCAMKESDATSIDPVVQVEAFGLKHEAGLSFPDAWVRDIVQALERSGHVRAVWPLDPATIWLTLTGEGRKEAERMSAERRQL
jgi:hypothetical protein